MTEEELKSLERSAITSLKISFKDWKTENIEALLQDHADTIIQLITAIRERDQKIADLEKDNLQLRAQRTRLILDHTDDSDQIFALRSALEWSFGCINCNHCEPCGAKRIEALEAIGDFPSVEKAKENQTEEDVPFIKPKERFYITGIVSEVRPGKPMPMEAEEKE